MRLSHHGTVRRSLGLRESKGRQLGPCSEVSGHLKWHLYHYTKQPPTVPIASLLLPIITQIALNPSYNLSAKNLASLKLEAALVQSRGHTERWLGKGTWLSLLQEPGIYFLCLLLFQGRSVTEDDFQPKVDFLQRLYPKWFCILIPSSKREKGCHRSWEATQVINLEVSVSPHHHLYFDFGNYCESSFVQNIVWSRFIF